MNTMKRIGLLFWVSFVCSLPACGQNNKNHQHQKISVMEINKISHPVAKAAIEAWQQGDAEKWLSFFIPDARLLDDGNVRNFRKFSTEAIGSERFTSIDKVEDNGLSVYGKFHSDTWGDFKFHVNEAGKVYQLEIGQADY